MFKAFDQFWVGELWPPAVQNFVFIWLKVRNKCFMNSKVICLCISWCTLEQKRLDIINNGPLYALLFHFLANVLLFFFVLCHFFRSVLTILSQVTCDFLLHCAAAFEQPFFFLCIIKLKLYVILSNWNLLRYAFDGLVCLYSFFTSNVVILFTSTTDEEWSFFGVFFPHLFLTCHELS